MRIERIILKEMDPLRIFTEQSLLYEEQKEQEGKEEGEEEDEERKKIAEIWESMTVENPDSKPGSIRAFLNLGPNLRDLATLLNRSDVQIQLSTLLKEGEKTESPPDKREMAKRVRTNLAILNGKIDRANSLWYAHIPLASKILWQIEKIKVPPPTKN